MFTSGSKPDVISTQKGAMGEHETDRSTTRREVLTAVGAIVAGLHGGINSWDLDTSTDNDNPYRKIKSSETIHTPMSDPVGYLTLPGVSFTSLLIHLPSIFSIPHGRSPIIIIDTHDYERFRGRVLTEKADPKVQYIGMMLDDLRRRGALKLIDYAKLYPDAIQQNILQQNQRMLEATEDHVNRNAAMDAADGWIDYGRGEYQEQFRASLGEDIDAFGDSRHKVGKQRDKMDQGLGDPIGWNENVMNQYRAALEVRYRANRHLDIDIPYIIGQGESALISTYNVEGYDSQDPACRFIEISPDQTAQTREMLEDIATMGQRIAGVQHTDWFMLGPRLALSQYDNIFEFNIDKISKQVRLELDTPTIIAQAKEARAIINERVERPQAQLEAGADYLAEQHGHDSEKLLEKLDEAVSFSNYSRELRELNDKAGFSQAALFLTVTVMCDPVRRHNEDEVYKQCMDTIKQLELPTVPNAEIEYFRNRGTYRRQGKASDESGDWYQSSNRWR